MLRRDAGGDGPDEIIGKVAVDWRRLSDGPADLIGKVPLIGDLLATPVRWGTRLVGDLDSYTELDEMELEVNGLVTGEPVRLRAAPAAGGAMHWEFSGRRSDWWARLKVQRDGVALPREFARS